MDAFLPAAQRSSIMEFAQCLHCRDAAVRRDACGDWVIRGKRGVIICDGPKSYQVIVDTELPRVWHNAKAAMSFGEVIRDGDDEGAIALGRLPTKAEASVIMRALRISKRKTITADHVQKLRAGLVEAREERRDRQTVIAGHYPRPTASMAEIRA